MVQLASMIACQALQRSGLCSAAALTAGVTTGRVKEIVYQAVPYVGISKVFDFIHATNDVSCRARRRIAAAGPVNDHARGERMREGPRGSEANHRRRQDRGEALRLGASRWGRCTSSATSQANCFGDNYTRTGLDIPTRELLTFSMLVALGGCDPQVQGPRRRQSACRQWPRQTDRRPDPVAAVHRLSPHA